MMFLYDIYYDIYHDVYISIKMGFFYDKEKIKNTIYFRE